jgi:hypothetical protein
LIARIDSKVCWRIQVSYIQIWIELVHIHLEHRLGLARIDGSWQEGAITTAEGDFTQGCVIISRRKIYNVRAFVTACN